ncbi:MAG: CDP-alcohol phosphatidyltransferase family protein [Candidatus Paracaedimonas acanthamoebae]|uniref:CDP-diacylglycerol--glycerol-3-phosphate 3-phosphatidyltransferase n=1 Tax=Candidatus Paracaedimonas acanthamoebae TaxID=244581 RepID=A0A8J7PPV7_9PROT|nr:CDP-alcohol phosphatidyltransferase family protein [Candidatus Paracaedimonas acanthamoebae]
MTWPNFISLGRLLSVPFIVWCILSDSLLWAFWGMVLAGLSDILDGLIARAMHLRTVLGSYLDPIADKFLLVGVFIALGLKAWIPLWLIILVVFRDVLIVGGMLLLMMLDKPITSTPILVSKLNTFLQISVVSLTLLQGAYHQNYETFNQALFMLTAMTTILSGAAYVKEGIKRLN